MNFQKSVEYLYSLGNEVLAMKLGLDAAEKLLAAPGNPEKNFLKIQIAGTNGKGSTCAFLDAICRSAKIKTGLFTSPHLISITERLKINGEEISEKDFARHATRVRKISENLVHAKELETVPTFFEQITAIAISAFAEAKIELAILETGLGGRFDATTAMRAEIVGITRIDFDHQNILGNSLAEIAAEKAAIIREDTRVVLGEQFNESEKILSNVCADFGVTPKSAQTVAAVQTGDFRVSFQTEKTEYENVKLNLPGRHQIENAVVAILLAETLQNDFPIIKTENIVEGLENAAHKGRLEFYKNILFDGAHNVGGAKALREFLDEFITSPITMIFGAMRDKDLSGVAEILFPKADRLIFTKANNPRSIEPENLLSFLGEYEIGSVSTASNAAEAIKLARQTSTADNLILVTGSLYLIGEAQKILDAENYV
ncbi:MAG: bifunctional folylpolyglutamate synthase/dihydrofolate synthase [Pyrinomonadaceae bacterium]